MAAKKIICDYSATELTVYAIVRREADGYRLDDADGTFAAAPADPYLSLAEHSVIKGRYEVSEARAVWNDGRYTVAVYKQTGVSPAPVSDTIIGTGEMVVKSDAEVYQDDLITSRLAAASYTAPDNAGIAANGSALTAIQGDVDFVLAIIRNKRYLEKVGATWYLGVRNDGDTADILRKALKGPNGITEITDVQAAAMGVEIKSSV